MFQEDEDAQLNKESWSVVKTLRYTTLSGCQDRSLWIIFNYPQYEDLLDLLSAWCTFLAIVCFYHLICLQGTHRRCVWHMLDTGWKLYGVWVCRQHCCYVGHQQRFAKIRIGISVYSINFYQSVIFVRYFHSANPQHPVKCVCILFGLCTYFVSCNCFCV